MTSKKKRSKRRKTAPVDQVVGYVLTVCYDPACLCSDSTARLPWVKP
jgi:uncharacterized protein (UPF0297 family)